MLCSLIRPVPYLRIRGPGYPVVPYVGPPPHAHGRVVVLRKLSRTQDCGRVVTGAITEDTEEGIHYISGVRYPSVPVSAPCSTDICPQIKGCIFHGRGEVVLPSHLCDEPGVTYLWPALWTYLGHL